MPPGCQPPGRGVFVTDATRAGSGRAGSATRMVASARAAEEDRDFDEARLRRRAGGHRFAPRDRSPSLGACGERCDDGCVLGRRSTYRRGGAARSRARRIRRRVGRTSRCGSHPAIRARLRSPQPLSDEGLLPGVSADCAGAVCTISRGPSKSADCVCTFSRRRSRWPCDGSLPFIASLNAGSADPGRCSIARRVSH